jgi:hypothetical protein
LNVWAAQMKGIRKASLVVILYAACRHAPQQTIDLSQVLRLETTSSPSEVIAGETIEATYELHNFSERPLDLCSASGVSIMLKSESPPYLWPMLLHGLTTDVECSGPIHIERGGTIMFHERGTVRRDLPDSHPALLGRLTVWCARRLSCRETTLESSVMLHVVRMPSTSLPHRTRPGALLLSNTFRFAGSGR